MKFSSSVLLFLVSAGMTQALMAHHSGAMFDDEAVKEMTGTIVEFQFTNPHTWIQVMVEDDSGEQVEWSLEWGSPNQLGRRGVRPSSLPPGAQVTVRTNPMRDGSPAGAFIGARLTDGNVVGRWDE